MKRRRGNRTEKPDKVSDLGEKLIAAGFQTSGQTSNLPPMGNIKNNSKNLHSKHIVPASLSNGKAVEKRPKKSAKQKERKNKLSQKSKFTKKINYLEIIDRQRERKLRLANSTEKTPLAKPKTSSQHPDTPSEFSIVNVQKRLESIALAYHFISSDYQIKSAKADAHSLAENFSSANRQLANQPSEDSATEILSIGFDFGSTASKIILRFPYNPSLGAFALPAPEMLQADDHPYYWRSILWRNEIGEYSLLPLGTSRVIERLKVDFLREARAPSDYLSEPKPIDLHVTAYITLILQQSIGWISRKLQKTLVKRKLEISANFGFPADRVDETGLGSVFKRCCSAALQLARTNSSVTEETLLAAHKVVTLSDAMYEVQIVPEFMGAVVGFFNSSRRRNGQYILCDFGGLTCDCVCFGFYQRNDGSSIISIYGSQIRNYGAEIVKVALAQHVPKNRVVAALGNFVAVPILDARQRTGPLAKAWGGEMPLFKIGGGRKHPAYKGVFEWASRSLERSTAQTSFREEELELEMDSSIDVHLARGRNNGRLLVAYGLSYSPLDLPDWLTKAQIAPKDDKSSFDLDARFVGPEQT